MEYFCIFFFFFSTTAKRNFQLKEVKQLIFRTDQQCREDLAEWLSQGEGRLRPLLFGWVNPELHTTSKLTSTIAQVSCSSEFGCTHQIVRTSITPPCLLLGVAETKQFVRAGTSPGGGMPLTILVMQLAVLV